MEISREIIIQRHKTYNVNENSVSDKTLLTINWLPINETPDKFRIRRVADSTSPISTIAEPSLVRRNLTRMTLPYIHKILNMLNKEAE